MHSLCCNSIPVHNNINKVRAGSSTYIKQIFGGKFIQASTPSICRINVAQFAEGVPGGIGTAGTPHWSLLAPLQPRLEWLNVGH